MNKKELIKQYLLEPTRVGDVVYVRGLGIQNKHDWGNCTKVKKIDSDLSIYISQYGFKDELTRVEPKDYKKYTRNIGYDPFTDKPWNSSLRVVNFDLGNILHTIGFDSRKLEYTTEEFRGVGVKGLNWNPTIVDNKDNEVHFHRGFVWSLKDNQLLIESIYNSINIGSIVIRRRSWSWLEDRVEKGLSVYFNDVVDGKQRLNAIVSFMQDKYSDLKGNYYSDLSDAAQHKFCNFMSLSYGELGENSTDEDVKSVFLGINLGVQMSQDHIEFVKSIKL